MGLDDGHRLLGQHSWNTPQAVNINAVDFGAAFLPQNQDADAGAEHDPGRDRGGDRHHARLSGLRIDQPPDVVELEDVPFDPAVVPAPFVNGVSFGFNDTISLYDRQNSDARLEHASDGSFVYRADQAEADELFQTDPCCTR